MWEACQASCEFRFHGIAYGEFHLQSYCPAVAVYLYIYLKLRSVHLLAYNISRPSVVMIIITLGYPLVSA